MIKLVLKHLPLLLMIFFTACGGSSTAEPDESEEDAFTDTVNAQKLVGTPFEGMTLGDSFATDYFTCGIYRTESITGFPINVFAAFFTDREEAIIAEGIDIINSAMGFEAYELADEWADDSRVMYKVDTVEDATARTYPVHAYFNGNSFSENQTPDWAIAYEGVSPNIVAHELAHASGIGGHYLVVYETDTLTSVEDNSLMEPSWSEPPAMTDFNYMMQRQGEVMAEHLNEVGGIIGFYECD